SGIAVGMATNIPPHNLGEVIDALCLFIEKDGNVELDEILSVLPGPDFPTGGIIMGRDGIVDAYKTGRGKLIVRGKAHEEESGRGRKAVVITEIPYMVNKASLVETIAREAKEGRINGVADIRDESDRRGLRIVIELQRDADPDLALRQLYTRTQLQTTFGVINLALVDAKPMTLPLLELLRVFVEHRRSVVRRRTAFRLKKAEERAHLVEGLVRALDMIDQVIALIRSSRDARSAETGLVQEFGFTQAQAKAILDMRLQRLTNLERHKLEEELASLLQDISRYNAILTSPKLLDSVVRDELVVLKDRYSDSRRTEISDSVEILAEEELIPESEIVVVLSRDGYLRRMPIGDYRSQGRGGKGVKGVNLSSEDEIARLIVTTTHRNVYFFTSEGRVFAIRGYVIPEVKSGKGKNVSRFLSLGENEEIVTLGDSCTERAKFVFFITKRGNAKRLPVSELEGLT
ncbi:MAG TPA: DNA gyrase subunit A, partial [Thermosynergistes sp.]|nr:DNA gyrase subunit A [Thermosynergistes sp.]